MNISTTTKKSGWNKNDSLIIWHTIMLYQISMYSPLYFQVHHPAMSGCKVVSHQWGRDCRREIEEPLPPRTLRWWQPRSQLVNAGWYTWTLPMLSGVLGSAGDCTLKKRISLLCFSEFEISRNWTDGFFWKFSWDLS